MKKIIVSLLFIYTTGLFAQDISTFDNFMNNISDRIYKNSKFLGNSEKDILDTRVFKNNEFKIIEIDLPGYGKENIFVRLENQNLIILANVEGKNDLQKFKKTYQNSIFVGEVSSSDIFSEYKDGVLNIKIPLDKIKPAKSEKIEIK